MTQLQPPESSFSIAEFISGDDELAVCAELDNEQWEEQFFNPSTDSANADSECEDEMHLEPPAPKQWEEQFFNSLAPSTDSANADSECEDEMHLEPPAPKLNN